MRRRASLLTNVVEISAECVGIEVIACLVEHIAEAIVAFASPLVDLRGR